MSRIELFPPSFEPWTGGPPDKSVAVLMSGGVDSSVTAHRLRQAGWTVVGITMKIPVAEQCRDGRMCCGADAAIVCHQMGLGHYFIDTQALFREQVVEPFLQAYRVGATPNPCVDCNTSVKFSRVWEFLEHTFGIRYLATGHYAQVKSVDGRFGLFRAVDRGRDQSYFLHGIDRDRLPFLLLPLGTLTKTQVRAQARELGLTVSEKPDSMELCFAGEGDYRNALDPAMTHRPGDILNTAGQKIGGHDGIASYTVGQRRGLRVAAGQPLYVVRISSRDNTVTLGTRQESSRRTVAAERVNVLAPEGWAPGTRLYGKIRSYGDPHPCTVLTAEPDRVVVEFETPQFAPTPGQRLVLYDGHDRVVAGGTIRGEEAETCHV